jgi:crotonobetainyl-CoA:carnitine CoA-transferase CaiB-like acyl-CoA transferase
VQSPITRDGPLAGISVIDCSVSVPAAFCTSLLQRLGAEVQTIVDVSDPRQARSFFLDEHLTTSPLYGKYLAHGKETVRIDLGSEAGRGELEEALSGADVLVEDWRVELLDALRIDPGALAGRKAGLVIASVTPYGRTGPMSAAPASDLTLVHGGGPGHATPGLVADPATMPPLRFGSHQGLFHSGLAAAINICAAVLLGRRSDPVPASPLVVDFSCHEAVANSFRQSIGTFAFYGGGLTRDLARGRGAGGTAEHRNIPCRDGWINMAWAGVLHWECVRDLLGAPEWMNDERLATPGLRYKNWALVFPHLEAWAQERDKEQIFYLCQGHRIPCAPVNDGFDLLAAGAFSSRSFWRASGDHGPVLPGGLSRVHRARDSAG